MTRLALAAVAAMLLLAAPAGAATRYVDDDGAQCAGAASTSIQAAVDASGPGDVVRVCAGTYAEQVVIDADKTGLRLLGQPAGAAAITSPAGGLEAVGVGFASPVAPLTVAAERATVQGLRVAGPLTASDLEGTCQAVAMGEAVVAGIALGGARARLDRVQVLGATLDCEPADVGFTTAGTGVAVLPSVETVVERSRIEDSSIGVRLFNATTTLRGNTIRGGSIGILSEEFSDALVRSNDVADTNIGLLFVFSRLHAVGNRFHANTQDGMLLDDGTSGIVERNFVDDNRDGITVGFIGPLGQETGLLVRRNLVRGNVNNGISVEGGPRGGGNTLTDNVASDNGNFDCFDGTSGDGTAGTADVWARNVGDTASPPAICRRR